MRALDIPAKAAHQRHTIKREPMRKRGFFRFGLSVIPHFTHLTFFASGITFSSMVNFPL